MCELIGNTWRHCREVKLGDMIFVFGSNRAGRHGKGAALYAKKYKGAINGIGEGLQGKSYAIPTKSENLETLPLPDIYGHVRTFIRFAELSQGLRFYVTKIGCGLAGYKDQDIAPMFEGAPDNCLLPEGWKQYVE